MNPRRSFLKQTLLATGGTLILPSALRGGNAPSKKGHVAMIGTGRQGINANLSTLLGMKNVRVVAVCDVDRLRMGFAKRMVDEAYGDRDCKSFVDFREAIDLPDLDAVVISSPDHWHGIQALAALNKGLHVCCEKAMTRYFVEGRLLADIARKKGLVFRLDSECRSHAYMQKTANLVLNGYLGKLSRLEVGVPKDGFAGNGNPEPMPVPKHLEYDLWLGPAPEKPYTSDRVHVTDPKTGRWKGGPGWLRISDYCSGMICNWGGHLIDVANWVNGTSHTGPISAEGTGRFSDPSEGLFDTIENFELQYKYANGVVLDYRTEVPYLRVEGEEGWIQAHWHSKGGLKAHDMNLLRTKLKDTDPLVPSRSDKGDFISAITDGSPVMIDAEAGHRVNSQCLLGLAAVKAGKKLEWDPAREVVTNDAEAEAQMKKSFHREGWELEKFL